MNEEQSVKIVHEYIKRLEAEIDRLRVQCVELAGQNERIKRDWRMCSKCDFVWCDPKETMLQCPRCEWEAERDVLRALNAELVEAGKEVVDIIKCGADPAIFPVEVERLERACQATRSATTSISDTPSTL